MSDRYDDLNPGAVVAALRSFPGRYRAALSADPTRDRDEIAALRAPDGRAVGELVAATVGALATLGDAVHRVLISDGATVPPIAVTTDTALPARDSGANLSTLLDRLETSTAAVADPVHDAPSASLLRTGTAPNGSAVTALDVARQAVRIGAENLLALQHAMAGGGVRLPGDDDDNDDD